MILAHAGHTASQSADTATAVSSCRGPVRERGEDIRAISLGPKCIQDERGILLGFEKATILWAVIRWTECTA